jgi:hypothetical protein
MNMAVYTLRFQTINTMNGNRITEFRRIYLIGLFRLKE